VALLQRHHTGRLAYAYHDRVDIEPIAYAFDENALYGRTSPGTKLTMLRHHPWVAFEVDEVEGLYDWRSVVVHGTLYVLDAAGGDRDRESYSRALEIVRRVDAEALTTGDVTPQRTVVFQVAIDVISGRVATTAE
jgi:nitroimidazol reductase NimA-like FMN-containing flavoprotein (pyridoxamine 5'-phosphate oxidase superfamily)